MAGELQPLDQKFPIVDDQGRPTRYFTQWAQQKQIDISGGITLDQAQQLIDDFAAARQIIAGRALDGGGVLSGDVTIDHAESLVTPGTYGSATKVPQFVVDQEGHVQGVTEVPISGGGGGAITKISDVTLAATATTLSFTAIPNTYVDLLLMIYPVVTGTSSDHNVMLTFNSDTGANYDWTIWSRFEGANSGGQTSAKVGITGFDTAHEGPIEIQVFRYADTIRAEKLFRSESSGSGGGNYFRRLFDGSWHPAAAAAINRIDINPNITLQIGTRAILYGRS
jgi:hypothetical protein